MSEVRIQPARSLVSRARNFLSQATQNPILVKELRSRMRGGRAFVTLTGLLIFLALMSYGIYQVTLVQARYSTTPVSPLIGQVVFAGLALIEMMIVCAVAPAVTAGALSGEKEKQTYEMLMATPLHPASILWGKLVSALSYIFLLIFAAIPMLSLVFIFGGVSLRDMIKTLVVILATAVMFGVVGLFFSALFGRSGRATAASYVVVVLLLFGPILLAAGAGILRESEPPRWLMIPSPITALTSAMSPSVNSGSISSIFWMLGNLYWFWGAPEISMTAIPRPAYHYSLPIYGAIALLLYLLSSRLVLPTRRWRLNATSWLFTAVILIGYLGAVTAAFAVTSNRYENVQIIAEPLQTLEPSVPVDRQNQIQPKTEDSAPPAEDHKIPPDATPTPLGWSAPGVQLSAGVTLTLPVAGLQYTS
jgi:ABC-type transport system involved in multi-copper enzyme maturation permease subunit